MSNTIGLLCQLTSESVCTVMVAICSHNGKGSSQAFSLGPFLSITGAYEVTPVQGSACHVGCLQVPRKYMWAESDNPEVDCIDSRVYGPVPIGLLHGRVTYRVRRFPPFRTNDSDSGFNLNKTFQGPWIRISLALSAGDVVCFAFECYFHSIFSHAGVPLQVRRANQQLTSR